MTDTTRRAVVFGAGGAGLAAVLTACAAYGQPTGEAAFDAAVDAAEEPPAEESQAAPKRKKEPKALAETADIPAGEGVIFDKQKVVVTQPVEGEFKAFTATCTHAGCTVAEVVGGTINCPCHGSKFRIEDGSVAEGPATEPLAEKKITVSGGKIRLG
ncbi:Rieske (2Fe-2S) protein [Nonomuraea ceibae]|uniref:Rieske (2Fe-2S) protein n=1 Tax=Nonomuraea ceibae TaxID=1935170 RepID=UPI001C5FA2A2|nr:Rieske (2Fe-2S) protein [Nonomuraea ceibae]